MKKVRQQANRLTDRINLHLKKMCSNLSPQKRMITIMCLCSAFGIASLYMTASSFYSIWRSDQDKNQTHQVNKESGLHHSEVTTDSIIKPSKQLEYE